MQNSAKKIARLTAVSLAFAAQLAAAAGNIAFTAEQAYPEGIAYSAQEGSFLVSSISHGDIGKVSPDGHYRVFIQDKALVSSVGMFLDAGRNTLWVANGDVGLSDHSAPETLRKLAAVAAYDATTGERRSYHDLGHLLPGAHFANDVAVDAAGNVYVTDSLAPVVYRVDPAGNASVFARDERFAGEDIALNGIVAHPDGYLLVNKNDTGELFRISLRDPQQVTAIGLPALLEGADGMVLGDSGVVTLVQNGDADRVVALVSADGWNTATVQGERKSLLSYPTTAAIVGADVYFLNSRLDTLMTPGAARVSDYLLQKY